MECQASALAAASPVQPMKGASDFVTADMFQAVDNGRFHNVDKHDMFETTSISHWYPWVSIDYSSLSYTGRLSNIDSAYYQVVTEIRDTPPKLDGNASLILGNQV